MKKDPQEVMIDALGELLQKASKAQERAARTKLVMWAILLVAAVILFLIKEAA